MLCKFCQHEFDDSLTECPYCHKQVDFEPKSLTREERDNFVGTTIEMEGNPGEEGYTKRAEYQEKDSYYQQDDAYQRADKSNDDNSNSSGFKVYRMGGGLLTWIIFVIIDKTIGMRVDTRVEEEGLDIYEHGESAYNL